MKPADVLVLNNIGGGFDILVKRLPNPHETIMMKHMHLTEDLAKGGNVAVALARLGISCTIIGKIGDDEAGRRDLDWMQAAGVDTSEVLVSSDVATGQGIGIIADNGDNILITGESSSEKLTWEEVQAAMLRRRGAGYFITIGMKVMLSAKRAVYMITTGSWKKTVLRVAMFSEPTLEYPVTLFPKYVPDITLLCDEFTADHPLSHPNSLVCERKGRAHFGGHPHLCLARFRRCMGRTRTVLAGRGGPAQGCSGLPAGLFFCRRPALGQPVVQLGPA